MTLLAAVIFSASDVSAATGDWPQYGFTAEGRRNNTQETILSRKTVPQLIKKWSANIHVLVSGAVVANGIVYVGSIDGPLYALDAKTGAPVWQAATGGGIFSSPAVVDGLVFVGSGDGRVYAFDAETGAQRWAVSSGGEAVDSAITVAGGLVYAGTNGGILMAINAKTGRVKWSTQLYPYGGGLSAPAVADGIAYINDYFNLNALDIRTGALLWKRPVDNRWPLGVPAVYGGLVIANATGSISAFDAKTGQSRWYIKTAEMSGSIAMGGGHVFAANGVELWSIDAATGKSIYASYVGYDATETPALANGVVYLATPGATISAFDSGNGKLLWQARTAGQVWNAPPTVSNGMLYVGSASQFAAYGLP
jgi:outer membrane protein assembly factor BamB